MYNRYIPQSDGSYQRRPCADAAHNPAAIPVSQSAKCPPVPPPPPPCPPREKPVSRSQGNAGHFLRNLLPGDFDTGDLMILLLLLLMAGDCPEERSSAWLTLALYLFL